MPRLLYFRSKAETSRGIDEYVVISTRDQEPLEALEKEYGDSAYNMSTVLFEVIAGDLYRLPTDRILITE